MTKEDFLVVRQIHPKNKNLYVMVVDKVSFSVHLLFGPRKTKVFNPTFTQYLPLTQKELETLKDLRVSDTIKNYITYPLTNFI
jgi:hypothetical protein